MIQYTHSVISIYIDENNIENIRYDHGFAINSNLVIKNNDSTTTICNKTIIIDIILYLLVLSSLTFIIFTLKQPFQYF
jgi:hypothetical protein